MFKQAVTVVETVSFSMFALWLLIEILASAVGCSVYLHLIVSISTQKSCSVGVCGPPAVGSLSGGLRLVWYATFSLSLSALMFICMSFFHNQSTTDAQTSQSRATWEASRQCCPSFIQNSTQTSPGIFQFPFWCHMEDTLAIWPLTPCVFLWHSLCVCEAQK